MEIAPWASCVSFRCLSLNERVILPAGMANTSLKKFTPQWVNWLILVMVYDSSKTRLIENMKVLMNKHYAKIRDAEVVEEMNTFIYSDEANQKGAGAQSGYHDDQLMATMLAYWGVVPRSLKDETSYVRRLLQAKSKPKEKKK